MFGSGNPDRTILTLPLVSREESLAISGKQPEKSPEKQPKLTRKEIIERRIEDVLALIKENPSISRADIAKALDITDSQAKTAIEKLKERETIHREGSDTNGKIEMVKGYDRIYRMAHSVTKTQKTILKAFGLDDGYIKERAKRISERLRIADEIRIPGVD